MSDLVKREAVFLATSDGTPELIKTVKDTVFADATDAEMALYFHDCERHGVHPLDRLIHPQVRKDKYGRRKYVAITSIDLMRSRAGDTGEHMGTDDAEYGPAINGRPEWARVTVYRAVAGQRCAFSATARWLEYCPAQGQDQMWMKMPHGQLAKCAEALALRKAFPRQLSGAYAREEMDQAGDAPDERPLRITEYRDERKASAAVIVDEAGAALGAALRSTASPEPAPAPAPVAAAPVEVKVDRAEELKALKAEFGALTKQAGYPIKAVLNFVNALARESGLPINVKSVNEVTSDEWPALIEAAKAYLAKKAGGGTEAAATESAPAKVPPPVAAYAEAGEAAAETLLGDPEAFVKLCQKAAAAYKAKSINRSFLYDGGDGVLWFIDKLVLDGMGLTESVCIGDAEQAVIIGLHRGVTQAMDDLAARQGRAIA